VISPRVCSRAILILTCKGGVHIILKRTKITSEIEYVESSIEAAKIHCCCGIIVNYSPRIVIDTNLGKEETRELFREVKPDIAIATHFHIDHSAMLAIALNSADAEVFVPAGEEEYLNDIKNYARQMGPGRDDLQPSFTQMLAAAGHTKFEGCHSYDAASDFGLRNPGMMQIIRTPGHSPRHHSFYFPGEKILLSGDIGLDMLGPWYGFPHCNLVEFVDSILRLMSLDIRLVITSHNGIISQDIQAALGRCINIIYDRETMISGKLDKGYNQTRIIDEGVIFRNSVRVPEPMRSLRHCLNTTAFEHHRRLILDGGMLKYFPETETILHKLR